MAKEEAGKGGKQKSRRPTAQKRILQSEKRRLQNRGFKSSVRTAIKRFEESVSKGDAAQIKEELSAVYSLMDKGVKCGVFKINKASRTKSRLTARAAAR